MGGGCGSRISTVANHGEREMIRLPPPHRPLSRRLRELQAMWVNAEQGGQVSLRVIGGHKRDNGASGVIGGAEDVGNRFMHCTRGNASPGTGR